MKSSLRRIIITDSWLLTYLVFFVFTTSEILQAVPLLNDVINVLRCFFFMIFLWNYLIGRKSIYVELIIMWQVAYIISSCLNENFTISVLFYTINAITITLFVKESVQFNHDAFIRRGRNWFFLLLMVNLLQMLFFTPYRSESGDVYILGLRVAFTIYCYAAVLFSLAYDHCVRGRQKISLLSVIIIGVAIVTLIIPMVATGIIGLIVILFAYIVLKREKNYWLLVVVAIVATWGIIYQTDFIQIFEPFLNLFGKDLTFSVRTYIWQRALKLIPLKPIWGYGISDMFVPAFGGVDHPAHNEILHVLYRGGVVSFVFIFMAFILVVKESVGKSLWSRICMSFLFGITIVMITEILSSQNAYQFIIALCYFINIRRIKIEKRKIDNAQSGL